MEIGYEFETDAYRDDPDCVRAHVNEIAGKALLAAVLDRFAARGFAVDDLFDEDWGWCGLIHRGADRYMLGAVSYDHPDEAAPAGAPPATHRVFLGPDDARPFRWQALVPFLATPPPPHASPMGSETDALFRDVLSGLDGVTGLRREDG